MTPEQIEQLKSSIRDTIQEKVNGKIDKIHEILEKQNEVVDEFKTKVENHIENDTKWKEDADPYIKGLANLTGSSKIIVYVAIAISTVLGAIVAIRKLLE